MTLFTERPSDSALIEQLEFALHGGGVDLPPPPANFVDSVVVRLDNGELLGEFVRDGDTVRNILSQGE